jgi:hypothetical protein
VLDETGALVLNVGMVSGHRICLLALALLLIAACGATSQQLVRRASFDLNCPQEQISVHQIDRRTRGARGCGQRAVYIQSCQGGGTAAACTWVLNADSTRDQSASQTPQQILTQGLQNQRANILRCTGGPVDVVAAFDASGEVSFSLAGPMAGTPAEQCVRSGLGRVTIPAPGRPGAVTHRIR